MKKLLLLLVLITSITLLSSCFIIDVFLTAFENKQNNIIDMDYVDYIGERANRTYPIAFFDLEGVPYIEIDHYFDAMSSIINSELLTIQKSDQAINITYTYLVSPTLDIDLSFDYDYESGIATTNHFEFFKLYQLDLILHEEIYHTEHLDIFIQPTNQVNLPLKDYHLEFINLNQKHYIQLDLANLMFAPEFSALYYSGDQVSALFDDNENIYDLGSKYFGLDLPNDVRLFTTYYLAFYFDHFYGNNFESNSRQYLTTFENRQDEFLKGNTNGYYQVLDFTFEDFSDGHLTMIYEGYYGTAYEFDYSNYEYQGRMEEHYNTIEVMETYCSESYSSLLTEDIALIFVEDFSTYALEVFAVDVLKYVKDNVIDVVIDMSCNSGGYLMELMDMLAFLTDDVITIHKANFKYGGLTTSTYTSLIPKIEQNLYIKTSPITYSSANIFTLYAKENNLATIIGTPSTGGSSHVIYLIGPAGMIFAAPSMYHFTNLQLYQFEFGVQPNYIIDNIDINQMVQLIKLLR
jgi:hypothetical protein